MENKEEKAQSWLQISGVCNRCVVMTFTNSRDIRGGLGLTWMGWEKKMSFSFHPLIEGCKENNQIGLSGEED